MKFFDPRMRIIMESVQPINRGYVRVTGKLVTLTRNSKFGSSKSLKALENVSPTCTNIILIFNIIDTNMTQTLSHSFLRQNVTIFHDSSFRKYFYVRINFNFETRNSP